MEGVAEGGEDIRRLSVAAAMMKPGLHRLLDLGHPSIVHASTSGDPSNGFQRRFGKRRHRRRHA
jgi:hypothetical protein